MAVKRRPNISLSPQTKACLDRIKHRGQSYDGLIQEMLRLWEKEYGIAEVHSETRERGPD